MKSSLTTLLLSALLSWTSQAQDAFPDSENELLATLQSETATLHEKGVACRYLAVIGTRAAIPVLVDLLDHPKLAHLARFGLEPMPYPEVDVALRSTLETLQGRHLVGVMNTIGVRRDAEAISLLEPALADGDLEVADAAAAALGHIATVESARILRKWVELAGTDRRPFLADASLTCADKLLQTSQPVPARNLFDTVGKTDVAKHVKLAAMRGAILARQDNGVRLLLTQLRGEDQEFLLLGMRVARELPGQKATRALSRLLLNLPPERQVLLATALGDRGDPVAQEAVIELAQSGTTPARVAALSALIPLGSAASVPVLLDAALSTDAEVAAAARSALFELPEGKFDRLLAARLSTANQAERLVIIETLADRRATQVEGPLLELADHADLDTRIAALKALGNSVTPGGWPSLVGCLVQAGTPQETTAANTALETACSRFDDKIACAGPLANALPTAPPEIKILLLQRLGQAGGSAALESVREYTVIGTPDPIRDTALRELTAWSDPAALPDLRKMIDRPGTLQPIYRTLAFRGYVRLVRDSELSTSDQLEALQHALALSRDTSEKRLVLGALGAVASPEALQLAVAQLGQADLAGESASAILQIARQLPEARYRDAVQAALNQLIKTSEEEAVVKQARQLLRNR